MPFTKQQIRNILNKNGQAFVSTDKLNYAGRICETYLRKKLYRWEDRAALDLYKLLKTTAASIRDYALNTAAQLRITTVGSDANSVIFRRSLNAFAQAQLNEFAGTAAAAAYQYAYTAYVAGYYGRLWMLDQASHHDPRVKPTRLPRWKASQAVLQPGLTEAVDTLAYEYDGSEWRDMYALAVAQSVIKVKRAVTATTTQPQGVLALTQGISASLGVNASPKQASKGLYHAVSLPTRTAVMRSANHASADVYKTHTEMLLGAMWVTSHDERVCPVCSRLDGHIYIINSLTGIALFGLPPDGSHYGCRCTIIPLMIPVEHPNEPPTDSFDDWLDEYGFADELDIFMQDDMLESTQL